ncbi:hypothetical protein SKAU_G00281780 [Synaphobranchus kaupii]|uniref:Uncharacterized protein n=1 Tax=Synaphobranchus kaupii TaxID=118154 RepID=A0A9Q1ILX1_SYNKA|nr:hypothetical protein SKAU_G00281780 [Synaphobranchus kaupii]
MLELGQTIRVTHLKGTKHHHYGFRLNSTSFTEIMEWDTGVREEEITVIGISKDKGSYILLTEDFSEVQLPSTLWMGSMEAFASRLPITVVMTLRGDVAEEVGNLFMDEE